MHLWMPFAGYRSQAIHESSFCGLCENVHHGHLPEVVAAGQMVRQQGPETHPKVRSHKP